MHDLAVISMIQSLSPIEGKDRIVVAKVENYDCIVAKDEFNVGDKVIYIFYDSILPVKPEFEFLRKRCWSEKYQGFRIRPMKLGGVISEGLVLSMSFLPEGEYKIGDVVTDKLGIRLYDPEALEAEKVEKPKKGLTKFLYKFKWFRTMMENHRKKVREKEREKNRYDSWTKKSDEENIERCYDSMKSSALTYIVTEKLEGQAFLASYRRGKFKVFSHNRRVDSGNWFEYAKQTHLREKLQSFVENRELEGLAISGELIGPNIQSNIYQRDELELYLYGGYRADGIPLTWGEIKDVASELGIPTVPFIREQSGITDDLSTMLKDSEGKSLLFDVPREGLVYRSVDGSKHFKVKSRSYKIWFEKKEDKVLEVKCD